MNTFLLLVPALVGAFISTGIVLYALWLAVRAPSVRRFFSEHFAFMRSPIHFGRANANPILPPGSHDWEAEAVMNPAAIRHDGKTHLFYRAIGRDGVSRIGYASSHDGVSIDERLPYPVFAIADREAFRRAMMQKYYPHRYATLTASGGSWSGTEDPRAVVIDDRLYLSFSAFHGWHSLRIGVSSLSLEDLRAKRWQWTPPVYLSPENGVAKNWVIFPKKFEGKYAVLHSLHSGGRDRVKIEYLNSLSEEPGQPIESTYSPSSDSAVWDTTMRGAGPPPIETKKGWLLFYHANDEKEAHKYKIGAMLLDLTDPSKVIARAQVPVLEPRAPYENNGTKPGIVYACGATVENDQITIYYGSADNFVCAAATSLSGLLDAMMHPKKGLPTITPLPMPAFT